MTSGMDEEVMYLCRHDDIERYTSLLKNKTSKDFGYVPIHIWSIFPSASFPCVLTAGAPKGLCPKLRKDTT